MTAHMSMSRVLSLALCAVSLFLLQARGAEKPEQAAADPGWPREYKGGKAKLLLYQPQIDSWKDFKNLAGRFAVELTPSTGVPAVHGTLRAEAETKVDLETRIVSYANFNFIEIRYPSAANKEEAQRYEELTKGLLPQAPTSVALDRILAYLNIDDAKTRQVAVSMEPPSILVSTQPAVLVIIDGKPIPLDIENTDLQKIVNTNWDLFFNKNDNLYYLRMDRVWLSAKDLNEPWMSVKKMSKEFKKLPDTDQYAEIKKAAASPKQPDYVTLVLVVDKPAELIVLSGEPMLTPVGGTALMWIGNTECDLFYDDNSRAYYFLTSGRWFRTTDLKSRQWEAATTSLPADFARIPADHPRAHVLAAVPGTKEAEMAVLAASIPQKAEIDRKSVSAKVDYVGDPKFEDVPGTGVSYATNTPNDVLKVGHRYYLCLEGVWFVSTAATGPWEAADKVPEEIYQIPPSSPKHNVTYVTVYESTPTAVTYGYTAGYTGVCIGYGVAMWGTGYYYPYYYGYGMYPYPVYWAYPFYTYGASAWYNPATGAYGRGSAVYGPYGGYARGGAYNPSTGRYSWGQTAWGPYGSAASGGFYNPSTGGWGGSYRASNGYQSWGQSVVGRGDQWARTGSYSDSRGTVGGFQTSSGAKGIVARGTGGQGGFAARSASGDIYAGRDGNVYRRDQATGEWSRNNGGSWESVNRPSSDATANRAARSGTGSESVQGLNRDASARQSGNYSAQRAESARQSQGRSYSGRSGGAATRGGGFGGRRR
jgi:hypothetical protein